MSVDSHLFPVCPQLNSVFTRNIMAVTFTINMYLQISQFHYVVVLPLVRATKPSSLE